MTNTDTTQGTSFASADVAAALAEQREVLVVRDLDLRDQKGRVVGGRARVYYHEHFEPREASFVSYTGEVKTYTETDWRPTGYVLCVFATRDGEHFGASQRSYSGLSLAEVVSKAEKMLAAQAKRYAKQFG